MVNGIICDLYLPRNLEEMESVISYLHQLHFIHGFEKIYVPEVAIARIREWIQTYNMIYLRKLEEITSREDMLVRGCEEELDSILWKMKRTDVLEAQLDSFLSLYGMWLQAKRLKSLLVQSMSIPTNPFSRLVHLLVGEQREFIDLLADDIELWLFSHFADLYAEWPYFFNFSTETAKRLQKNDCYRHFHNQFINLRTTSCTYSTERSSLMKREETISRMLKYCSSILESLAKEHGKDMILTKASLTVSNETLVATRGEFWNYSALSEFLGQIREPHPVFSPSFVHIKFYPLVLLKSIKPFGSLSKSTNPLVYYSSFEEIQEAELKFALTRFRKRLKTY